MYSVEICYQNGILLVIFNFMHEIPTVNLKYNFFFGNAYLALAMRSVKIYTLRVKYFDCNFFLFALYIVAVGVNATLSMRTFIYLRYARNHIRSVAICCIHLISFEPKRAAFNVC